MGRFCCCRFNTTTEAPSHAETLKITLQGEQRAKTETCDSMVFEIDIGGTSRNLITLYHVKHGISSIADGLIEGLDKKSGEP